MMKKIVIVDDDPAIQDAFRLIFAREKYEVTIYTDASFLFTEAFIIPDLFILDKQLSGIDGLDLCRMLKSRADTKDVPVVILSASPGILRLASEAGADDVLEKPFRIMSLMETIRRYIS